ncbi:hypothetical protein MRX96_046640 [Rhipicephalus microplus]
MLLPAMGMTCCLGGLLLAGAACDTHGSAGMTPLHMAALGGYTDCCRKLLHAGAKVDARDDQGRTALHSAAYGGNQETLQLLFDRGADCFACDSFGRLPLHYSAGGGSEQQQQGGGCLSALLAHGSDVDRADVDGRTPLLVASASGDSEGRSLTLLLEHGAQPATQDNRGFGALHHLAAAGHLAPLTTLLSVMNTEEVRRTKSRNGLTPLHLAALGGHSDCLQALLSVGCLADVLESTEEEQGWSALALSALLGQTACLRHLLLHGAQPLGSNPRTGATPVHAAAALGQTECLEILLHGAKGSDAPNARDASNRTPLMLAVLKGHADCVELLLRHGAAVDAEDMSRRTALFYGKVRLSSCVTTWARPPMHLAAAVGNGAVLSMLLRHSPEGEGADRLVDLQGFTPIHWACYGGHGPCLGTLLEHTRTNKFYGNSFSPLHCAAFHGSEFCIELLLNHFGKKLVQLRDKKQRTALHAAACDDSVLCLQTLVKEGADINAADCRGQTPLMMAAAHGSCKSIEALLELKADILVQDSKGNSALHHACLQKQEGAVATLLGKADFVKLINMINDDMKTALHVAASNGLIDATQALLLNGADVLATDVNGHTPALSCARSNEVAECLALILAVMPSSSPFRMDGFSRGSSLRDCSEPCQSSDSEYY